MEKSMYSPPTLIPPLLARPAGRPMPGLRIRSCGRTDIGLLRERNEDFFDLDDHEKIYLLADGMGGGPHGDVAARIAVDVIHETIARQTSTSRTMERLTRAIGRAQKGLCEAIQKDPELIGMGTTVVGLLVENDCRAVVAHVGDSRAYRLRDGELELLTRDHTVVASLVAEGRLSAREAEDHPLSHVLTRALTHEMVFEADASSSSIADGDLFLLCSDGLTDMLSDAEIRSCLTDCAGAQETCDRLIQEALERGGQDNITVVLVEVIARCELGPCKQSSYGSIEYERIATSRWLGQKTCTCRSKLESVKR